MNVLRLVASSGFLTVNLTIAREFGLDAAVVLGELASSQVYWEERDALEDGMFFETVEQIEARTTLSKYQQSKAIKQLEDIGVLKTKKIGIPAKRYFCVDGEKLALVLDHKKSKNLTTGGQKTSPQEVKKLDCNNKRDNKKRKTIKDINNIVDESSLTDPVKDKLKQFLEYRTQTGKPFKSEIAVNTLVKQVEKQEQVHGATGVIWCIDNTMSNGWQGLFWDKVPKRKQATGADAYFEMAQEAMYGTGGN